MTNDELDAAIAAPAGLRGAERKAWYGLSYWADDDDVRATASRPKQARPFKCAFLPNRVLPEAKKIKSCASDLDREPSSPVAVVTRMMRLPPLEVDTNADLDRRKLCAQSAFSAVRRS